MFYMAPKSHALLAVAVLLLLSPNPVMGEDSNAASLQQEAQIRETGAGYRGALARGDADALTSYWTADGEYVDAAGHGRNARDLIEEQFGPEAAQAAAPVSFNSSIRFVTDDVAIEEGTYQSSAEGSGGSNGQFMAVWVKGENGWLLDSLREWAAETEGLGNPLEPLAWMLGDWVAQGEGYVSQCSIEWSEDHAFLVRRFTLAQEDGGELTGTQYIGWDARSQRILSWTFDSAGGIVEGSWRNVEGAWIVESTGSLRDGRETSSISFWMPENENEFVMKVSHARVGETALEDIVLEYWRLPAE